MDDLKPCPFCRKADAFVERADFSSCYVVCNDCGARGPTSCDENDGDSEASESGECEPGEMPARRLWNTRQPDTRIAALEEALPAHIGRLHLGEKPSNDERLCNWGHDIPAGHPLYWPEQISQYDDSDPCCLEHAIEQYVSEAGYGYDATPQPTSLAGLITMLKAITREEGCAIFEHSFEEIGIEVMEHHDAILAALTGSDKPGKR